MADSDLVTVLNTESGGDVCGEVLVALLVTGVLGDEVEVLAADDEGTVHLGGDDGAGQDTATNRDLTDEGALLVCGRVLVAVSELIVVSFRSSSTLPHASRFRQCKAWPCDCLSCLSLNCSRCCAHCKATEACCMRQ